MSESPSEQDHESESASSPSIIVLGDAPRDCETGETTFARNTDSITDSSSQISNHRSLEVLLDHHQDGDDGANERNDAESLTPTLEDSESNFQRRAFVHTLDAPSAIPAQKRTADATGSSNRDIGLPLASSLPPRFAASPIDEFLEGGIRPEPEIGVLFCGPHDIQHANSLPTGLGNVSGVDSSADLPTVPKHHLQSVKTRPYDHVMSPSRAHGISTYDQSDTDVNVTRAIPSNIQQSVQSQVIQRNKHSIVNEGMPAQEGTCASRRTDLVLSPSSNQEVSHTDQWSIEVDTSPKKEIFSESPEHVPNPQLSACDDVAIECTLSPDDNERCDTTSSDDMNQCDLESMPLLPPRQARDEDSEVSDESADEANRVDPEAADASANRPLNYGRFHLPSRIRRRNRDGKNM